MKNRTVTDTVLAAALVASLALSGCPSLRVGQVRLAAPPKGGKATLVVDVETKIEVKPEEDQPGLGYSGTGVVAIWLPTGWKATAARIRVPGEDQPGSMSLVPDLAPEFPTTFPFQPGEWWTFVTGNLWITVEPAVFPVEIDLEGPARAKALVLGIALGGIDNCGVRTKVGWEAGDNLPTEIAIDLRKGTVAVREQPAPVDVQLPGCVKKPEPDAGLEPDAGPESDAAPPTDATAPSVLPRWTAAPAAARARPPAPRPGPSAWSAC